MKRSRLVISGLTGGIFIIGVITFMQVRGHLIIPAQFLFCLWLIALWAPTIAMWKAPVRPGDRDWAHYQAMMADVLVLVALDFIKILGKSTF